MQPVHREVVPRHRDDAALLPPGDGFGRRPATDIAPRLHLNKYDGLAVGGNDVNFANPGAIAPGNNCVPQAPERVAREVFAEFPEADRFE